MCSGGFGMMGTGTVGLRGVVWCGVVWCGVVWCGVVWWVGVGSGGVGWVGWHGTDLEVQAQHTTWSAWYSVVNLDTIGKLPWRLR
jgi:hypothetical protein